jgi:hypothetical protein
VDLVLGVMEQITIILVSRVRQIKVVVAVVVAVKAQAQRGGQAVLA